jgi:phospholipase/lecithinase/hemolysin
MTRTNRKKKGNLSERSEFVSLPDLCVASTGTSRSEAANRGRLSLLTFFGEAKKVSGCRAAPGNHGRPKKKQYQLRKSVTKENGRTLKPEPTSTE